MTASALDKFVKVGEGTATTLAAPGFTSGGTAATVVSTTNWPTDTGVIFAIDTAEIVDGEQVQVAGTYTEYRGVVSGATSITSVALVSGTPQDYSAGALTRVYIPLSSEVQNRMVDGILVSHNQDGTMIDSLPLTTPKITTSINDANGNEVLITPATASAVNEFTVTNAATGVAPRISASGGDTNVDLVIAPKGTGKAYIDSLSQWQRGTGTWTYVSATTLTVPQADADAITKGTKLWFTQTTSKYFYVASISGTTVTIVTTTDYTLANAAVTAPYYSNASTPFGFPDWFNYTPTLTNLSGGTINLAKYQIVGKTARFKFRYTLAGAGVSGAIRVSLPVSANADEHPPATYTTIGSVNFLDSGVGLFPAYTNLDSTTGSALITCLVTNATYGTHSGTASTIPFTWAVNDQIYARGEYEMA